MNDYKAKIQAILKGIDKDMTDDPDGWWETSTGVEFGKEKLQAVLQLLTDAKIDEINKLAVEGKRVGGFGTVPNLQNYLKLRLAELKGEKNE